MYTARSHNSWMKSIRYKNTFTLLPFLGIMFKIFKSDDEKSK